MANSIDLVTKFQPILDEVYKAASLTAVMDAPTKPVEFAGANVVKVMKTSIVGLGTYSRATGYPAGDVTVTWESLTLATERGRKLTIDRMDNDETLGMAFGTVVGEFLRTKVVPEVDAYRFAKYASWGSIGAATPATLTASTALAAIDTAAVVLDEAEVPPEGRLLYVSATVKKMIDTAVTRMLMGTDAVVDRRLKMLDNMTIIPVPQTRFYTAITLDAGASGSAGSYSKGAGKDINFMLLHPSAVLQAMKHDNLKIFDPDVNQTSDGWLVEYRLYHDAFVYENKVAGVYVHNKA